MKGRRILIVSGLPLASFSGGFANDCLSSGGRWLGRSHPGSPHSVIARPALGRSNLPLWHRGEIASHERLAMTDNWGSPSPVPALAPLSLRVLHSAGALTLREDTRRIASHKYYGFSASCRRFLRRPALAEAISLSDISGDCFARAARNDRKEKRFAGCQWHAARNQDHAALPKDSRGLPHHTCATLNAYTHYSFIRSLSFVDGPLPTNFS